MKTWTSSKGGRNTVAPINPTAPASVVLDGFVVESINNARKRAKIAKRKADDRFAFIRMA